MLELKSQKVQRRSCFLTLLISASKALKAQLVFCITYMIRECAYVPTNSVDLRIYCMTCHPILQIQFISDFSEFDC